MPRSDVDPQRAQRARERLHALGLKEDYGRLATFAHEAGVTTPTMDRFAKGTGLPMPDTLAAIERTLDGWEAKRVVAASAPRHGTPTVTHTSTVRLEAKVRERLDEVLQEQDDLEMFAESADIEVEDLQRAMDGEFVRKMVADAILETLPDFEDSDGDPEADNVTEAESGPEGSDINELVAATADAAAQQPWPGSDEPGGNQVQATEDEAEVPLVAQPESLETQVAEEEPLASTHLPTPTTPDAPAEVVPPAPTKVEIGLPQVDPVAWVHMGWHLFGAGKFDEFHLNAQRDEEGGMAVELRVKKGDIAN